MKSPDVSIVVPMFNEEDNVAPLCAAIRSALAAWERTYELIVIDDGSSDRTVAALQAASREDPRLRVVQLSANRGQTQAMAAGFRLSRGRAIVSMDGDLQNDPIDIPRIVDKLDEGFDFVTGWRKDRKDPWLTRKLPSRVANRMIGWITGVPVHDNGCSLKAYRAEVIRSLNLYSEMHRFLPALSAMTGARIAEIVVRHHPRTRGISKYGLSRTFRVLADMVTVHMVTRFGARPGRWFGLLSLPWLMLTLVTAAAWIVRIAEQVPTIVFSTLCVMFFHLFGLMLTLAIVSETYLAVSDRSYHRLLSRVLVVERRPAKVPS